ncbi:Nucleoside 5-triphosphatase RdgB (dHAPTP, dITP, XTP-specific) [Helicobacter mustelae]|uniref:hypothetical protein n=1 Tax=Helicobacter mustelae TaxID=217 RepID=UPI000DFFAB01|nr:Nucleoside 5-triphosphatase RdgB (dHAPTP, dITP, XTP-specific) [Helicobacter mustelae]
MTNKFDKSDRRKIVQELLKLSEEPLKSKIKDLYFSKFHYHGGKIDFCITKNLKFLGEINLLWAEAKQGQSDHKDYLLDASLYDMKEFFQGRDDRGRMNPPSKAKDEHYKNLLNDLNMALRVLAKKLEPKIYEYGFLKE